MTLHARLPYRDDDGALADLNADLDRAMATLAGLIAAGHRVVVLERLAHLLGGGAHPRSAVPEPAVEAGGASRLRRAEVVGGAVTEAPSKTSQIDDRLELAAQLVAVRRARRLKRFAPQLDVVAAELTATLQEDHR